MWFQVATRAFGTYPCGYGETIVINFLLCMCQFLNLTNVVREIAPTDGHRVVEWLTAKNMLFDQGEFYLTCYLTAGLKVKSAMRSHLFDPVFLSPFLIFKLSWLLQKVHKNCTS